MICHRLQVVLMVAESLKKILKTLNLQHQRQQRLRHLQQRKKQQSRIPQYIGEEKFTEKPVTQMRKVIAKRLAESLFTAPHFYLTMSIDMDNAMAARTKMNEYAPVKISFNDIVIKAVAVALKQHPAVNSSWLGDKIRYNEHVNIGVAVAVEDGLIGSCCSFC